MSNYRVCELSGKELDELEDCERLAFNLIRQAIAPHLGESVDASRTRFLTVDLETTGFNLCEIRRTEHRGLDLDIFFGTNGPRLDAGPTPAVIPQRKFEYRLWEPYFLDYPDLETYFSQIGPFVRDWLSGRMILTTTYAGSKPFRWVLRRGDESLGNKSLKIFPYFSRRRSVVQRT